MKLCPQCEFIYEDDQRICDMDGESLVYDPRSEVSDTLPAVDAARPAKSRLRTIVIAVFAGLALLALLSLAYYASSTRLVSDSASRSRKPEAPESRLERQTAPPLNNPSPPTTNSSESLDAEAASDSVRISADKLTDRPAAEPARGQVASKATNNTLRPRDNRLVIARGLPPLPQVTPLPRVRPLKRLPAAKPLARLQSSSTLQQPGPASQIPVTNQKALIVEVKPGRGDTNKPSRVKSFLKKTGRIFKRPFKF